MDIRASMQLEDMRTISISRSAQKIKKISAIEVARTVISASHDRKKWLSDNVKSKEFVLADIPLNSVATLHPVDGKINLKASLDEEPIVVDVNKQKLGKTSGKKGYLPSVIVIHGSGKHAAYRLKGKSTIKAWVGAEAMVLMGLMADHQFGAQELNDKLAEILREKLVKKTGNKNDLSSSYPWIVEVYPFEDYFIYRFEGKLYKQNYKCDVKKRTCTFDGESEQVVQKYVDLDANTTPMEKTIRMTSEIARQAPNGNKAKSLDGNIYNGTSPGSGVGPRVKMSPPSKSEVSGKL